MSSSNGASKDAFANSGTASGLASSYGNRATGAYNVLTPTLNGMVNAPQGYGQRALGDMNTAAMQSVGGANAGTVGGAMQTAARTNNAGGYDPAIAQSGRDATSQLSNAALNVQNRNAQLQQEQKMQGIQGMEGMYGQNVGAGENALGLSNQALNTAIQGDNSAFARHMALWQMGAQAAGAAMGA